MAIDPVCGMEVDESTAPSRARYGSRDYYFCTPLCLERFMDDPRRYVSIEEDESSLRHLFRLR